MASSSTHSSPSRKDHTYVVLAQNPDDSEDHQLTAEQLRPEDAIETEEIDIQVLDDAIGDKKPMVGLFSKTRFSDLKLKLFSALFYGSCSFLITVINKIVLTSYSFPSSNLLAVGQMVAILIILQISSQLNVITIRKISYKNKKMWTLAIIYLGNLITGLGGTKHLPLPMFIALRRFSIAITAIGEFYLLHVKQTLSVIMTIVAMIGGSLLAAVADLSFNAIGYLLVMSSNLFTAANVVYIKKTIDSKEINKHEILFYNALFTIVPAMIISFLTCNLESLYNYNHWTEFGFVISFLTSCVMGYLLMYSMILCTHYNSPLTTTIIGTLKNILTTYVGMYIGGDYQYSALNFIGLNISLVGSLVYSYLTFVHKSSKDQQIKN